MPSACAATHAECCGQMKGGSMQSDPAASRFALGPDSQYIHNIYVPLLSIQRKTSPSRIHVDWGGSGHDSVSVPETECGPQWKCDTMSGVKYGLIPPTGTETQAGSTTVQQNGEKLKSTYTSSTSDPHTHLQLHQRPEE